MSNAVKKALSLLEHVAAGQRTLAELSAATGLPRPTAHRLAGTLVSEGFLVKDELTYRLGYRLLELGNAVKEQDHIVLAAREPMERLSERTCETVHLGQLDGTSIVYIDKVEGNRGLRMASRIGFRTLAQTTSLGKVLIASLPEETWERHLVPGVPPRTPNTIVELDRIVAELSSVRDAGYALDREENELGIRCVACPIRDFSGRVVAAISLSGATVYVTEERQHDLVADVRDAAHVISVRLGYDGDR